MSPDEFKALIPQLSDSEIVSQVILAGSAVHVSESNITYLIRRIAESFGVNKEEVRLHIVGSAKLGFSLSEKRKRDGRTLPRYRPFCDKSDIDVAIVCTSIFSMLWADLSAYAYRKARIMPWDSRKLGHYLVHGWLRPDHFPGRADSKCSNGGAKTSWGYGSHLKSPMNSGLWPGASQASRAEVASLNQP